MFKGTRMMLLFSPLMKPFLFDRLLAALAAWTGVRPITLSLDNSPHLAVEGCPLFSLHTIFEVDAPT